MKSQCEITRHFSHKLTHSNTQEGNDTAKWCLIAFANQRDAGSPENNRWTRSESHVRFERVKRLSFTPQFEFRFFFSVRKENASWSTVIIF